jgi:GDPmannose 4,6-dehydratase
VIIRISPRYFPFTEVEILRGAPSRARAWLGRILEISVQEMCREMAALDLRETKRHVLLKVKGYAGVGVE